MRNSLNGDGRQEAINEYNFFCNTRQETLFFLLTLRWKYNYSYEKFNSYVIFTLIYILGHHLAGFSLNRSLKLIKQKWDPRVWIG
jgi:hypothetical protein